MAEVLAFGKEMADGAQKAMIRGLSSGIKVYFTMADEMLELYHDATDYLFEREMQNG